MCVVVVVVAAAVVVSGVVLPSFSPFALGFSFVCREKYEDERDGTRLEEGNGESTPIVRRSR